MDNKAKQDYHKHYYENNKNKFIENSKKNKDKVVFCDICKKNVKYFSMSSHRKSERHIANNKTVSDDKITEQKILTILRKLIDFN